MPRELESAVGCGKVSINCLVTNEGTVNLR